MKYRYLNEVLLDWGNSKEEILDNNIIKAQDIRNKLGPRTFTIFPGIKFNMIYVEGGTFVMGSNDEYDTRPLHNVTLSDYLIGETTVTKELWEAVMNNQVIDDKKNYPISYIRYDTAIEFTDKLSELIGVKFTLPTEAQWEFAARGGNKSCYYRYAGSNNLGTVAWYCDNSKLSIHPVKQLKPNELGIYDMCGNVYEWCLDRPDDYPEEDVINPIVEKNRFGTHILRGGAIGSYINQCTVYYRNSGGIMACSDCGMRLVINL